MNKNKVRILILTSILIGLSFFTYDYLKKEAAEKNRVIPKSRQEKKVEQIADCFQTENKYPAKVCFSGFNPDKTERDEIQKKLINPMVDYYNEDGSKLVSLNIEQASILDYQYSIDGKMENNDSIDFVLGQKNKKLEYWFDDSCMGPCVCSDKFIKKYPEIACMSKREAAIITRSRYELDEADVDNSAVKQGKKALIEGTLSFPSEVIPEMIVCAINKNNEKEKYCTENRIKSDRYLYKIGYQILVPAGEYYVKAEKKKRNTGEGLFYGYSTNKTICLKENGCDLNSDKNCPPCQDRSNDPDIIKIGLGDSFSEANILDWQKTKNDTKKEDSSNSNIATPTENWKEYLNKEKGFGFKYPPNWEYKIAKNGMIELREINKTYKTEESDVYGISISVEPAKNRDKWKEVIKSHGGKLEEITIDKNEATRATDYLGITTIIYHNNKEYILATPNFGSDKLNQEVKDTYDLLINTLIIDESISIKNWKEYSNKKEGFGFKYPSNWNLFDYSDRYKSFRIFLRPQGVDEGWEYLGDFEIGVVKKEKGDNLEKYVKELNNNDSSFKFKKENVKTNKNGVVFYSCGSVGMTGDILEYYFDCKGIFVQTLVFPGRTSKFVDTFSDNFYCIK